MRRYKSKSERFVRKAQSILSKNIQKTLPKIQYKFIKHINEIEDKENVKYLPYIYKDMWDSYKMYSFFDGGRGSGKSHFVAYRVIKRHIEQPGRVTLCVREHNTRLSDSMLTLLENIIAELGLGGQFFKKNHAIHTPGGGVIKFSGLADHNAMSIKSFEGANECVIEEANEIGVYGMNLLMPTIYRNEGGTITFIWNPEDPDHAVDKILASVADEDKEHIHTTIDDNPFATEMMYKNRASDYRADEELAKHTWLGIYKERTQQHVFSRIHTNKQIDIPALLIENRKTNNLRLGLDFGFATDEMAVILSYVDFENYIIYILSEGYKTKVEVTELSDFIKYSLPQLKVYPKIMADSARADLISHLKNHGWVIEGVKKGAGSINKGIAYLKMFDIYVDRELTPNFYNEAKNYKYKIEKLTNKILDDPVDKQNHLIDSLRYSVEEDMLRHGSMKLTDYL